MRWRRQAIAVHAECACGHAEQAVHRSRRALARVRQASDSGHLICGHCADGSAAAHDCHVTLIEDAPCLA